MPVWYFCLGHLCPGGGGGGVKLTTINFKKIRDRKTWQSIPLLSAMSHRAPKNAPPPNYLHLSANLILSYLQIEVAKIWGENWNGGLEKLGNPPDVVPPPPSPLQMSGCATYEYIQILFKSTSVFFVQVHIEVTRGHQHQMSNWPECHISLGMCHFVRTYYR